MSLSSSFDAKLFNKFFTKATSKDIFADLKIGIIFDASITAFSWSSFSPVVAITTGIFSFVAKSNIFIVPCGEEKSIITSTSVYEKL